MSNNILPLSSLATDKNSPIVLVAWSVGTSSLLWFVVIKSINGYITNLGPSTISLIFCVIISSLSSNCHLVLGAICCKKLSPPPLPCVENELKSSDWFFNCSCKSNDPSVVTFILAASIVAIACTVTSLFSSINLVLTPE